MFVQQPYIILFPTTLEYPMVGNIQIKSGIFDYVLSFRSQLGKLFVFDSNAELSKRCLQIQYQISNLNLIVYKI